VLNVRGECADLPSRDEIQRAVDWCQRFYEELRLPERQAPLLSASVSTLYGLRFRRDFGEQIARLFGRIAACGFDGNQAQQVMDLICEFLRARYGEFFRDGKHQAVDIFDRELEAVEEILRQDDCERLVQRLRDFVASLA